MCPPIKTSAPHIRTENSVPKIFWGFAAFLLPFLLTRTFFHGPGFLRLVFASVAAGVLAEALSSVIFKTAGTRGSKIYDGNTVGISLLFAALLPSSTPSTFAALVIFLAVFLAKECFGGTGSQIFHPAFVGVVLLAAVGPVSHENKMTAAVIFLAGIYAVLDPVTTPTSRQARLAFALLLAGLFLIFAGWQPPLPAMAYAVLLSNAAVPNLDEFFLPRGSAKSRKKGTGTFFSLVKKRCLSPFLKEGWELFLALILISYVFFIGAEVWLPPAYQGRAALFLLPLLSYFYYRLQKKDLLFLVALAAAAPLAYFKHPQKWTDRLVTGAAAGTLYGLYLALFAGLKARLLFCNTPRLLKGSPLRVLTGVLLALSLVVFLPKLP